MGAILRIPAGCQAFDREEITVDGTAAGVSFTSTKVYPTTGPQAKGAIMVCTTQPIRVTLDGTSPVGGSTGLYMAVGDTLELNSPTDVRALKAIRDTGSSGALCAIFYR